MPKALSFLVGAATAIAGALTLTAFGVLAGLSDRVPLWLPPVAVIAVAAAAAGGAWVHLDGLPYRAGAVAGGLGLLVAVEEVPLMVVAALTGVVAAWVGPLPPRRWPSPDPRVWTGVGLLLVAATLLRVVADGGILGHDEAAIALKARAWLEGTPDTGWSIHRGIGASVLAVPVVAVTDSGAALRIVAVAGALATVAAVGYLGRAVGSRRAALMAAGVFSVGYSFLRRGSEFLTDLPSAGLLVIATALLWRWLQRDGGDRLLYGAVALGVLALYVRYQSVLTLGLLVLVAVVSFRARITGSFSTVARATALGVGLAAPLLVWSIIEAGTAWAPFSSAAKAGGREFLGQGLVDYLRAFPYFLAGPLGAGAILVAIGWLVVGRRRREQGRGDSRLAVFLVVPALGQMVLLGLISHGEPRFVFYPVALLIVAGAVAIDEMGRSAPSAVRRGFVATLLVALVVALAEAGTRADRQAEDRAGGFVALAAAAEVAAAEAPSCALMTGHVPQVTWLTGCAAFRYGLDSVRVPDQVRSGGAMILFDGGIRQPEGGLLDRYVAEAGTEIIEVDGDGDGEPDGRVYLFSG